MRHYILSVFDTSVQLTADQVYSLLQNSYWFEPDEQFVYIGKEAAAEILPATSNPAIINILQTIINTNTYGILSIED